MEKESFFTVEDVTKSEVLGLATWDRQRTDEELRHFLLSREVIVDSLSDPNEFEYLALAA